jgi:hypothetical protein
VAARCATRVAEPDQVDVGGLVRRLWITALGVFAALLARGTALAVGLGALSDLIGRRPPPREPWGGTD